MSSFSVVYPPSNTFINTYASDTARSIFTWTKSSSHPSIRYKWKIRKDGTSVDLSYNSNNNGSDSVIILRNSFLDSLAMGFGGSSDTVSCIWKVYSYNGSDSLSSQNQNFIFIARHTVGIKVISSSVPGEFKLFQNYPNPFNPVTKISFDIPVRHSGEGRNPVVKLIIFDALGREVETLVNQQMNPGSYNVSWDASQNTSGVYFYRMTAEGFSDTKKLLLLK